MSQEINANYGVHRAKTKNTLHIWLYWRDEGKKYKTKYIGTVTKNDVRYRLIQQRRDDLRRLKHLAKQDLIRLGVIKRNI